MDTTALNIAAILLSPLIAVLVTVYLQDREKKQNQKLFILSSLMGTRHAQLTDESVRSLNMIDMIFSDKDKIRQLWHEYFDMLGNQGLNNPNGFSQRDKKRLDLITEMAKALGLGEKITHLDVDRVYLPQGFVFQSERNEAIASELLVVLKRLAVVLEAKPQGS